jgi:hypothetical protein
LIPEPEIGYKHKTAGGEVFVVFNGDSEIGDLRFKTVTVILL